MCKILVQNFIIKDILKKKNVVHWISVRTIPINKAFKTQVSDLGSPDLFFDCDIA